MPSSPRQIGLAGAVALVPAAFVVATLAISGFLIVHELHQTLQGLPTVASGLPTYRLRPT